MNAQCQSVSLASHHCANFSNVIRIVPQYMKDRAELLLSYLVDGTQLNQRGTKPIARFADPAGRQLVQHRSLVLHHLDIGLKGNAGLCIDHGTQIGVWLTGVTDVELVHRTDQAFDQMVCSLVRQEHDPKRGTTLAR